MNLSPHSWRRRWLLLALFALLCGCSSPEVVQLQREAYAPAPAPLQHPELPNAKQDHPALGVNAPSNSKQHLAKATTGAKQSAQRNPSPMPTERAVLQVADNALAHAFPPMAAAAAAGAAAPVAVMLHGMCGSPMGACRQWRDTPQQHGWLLCPSGNTACGGGYDWHGAGEQKAVHIDAALSKLREMHPQHVAAPGGDILMGFSRGAFVARDVAYARPGQYRGLVLIGASLKPDAARLRRSGIQRVVLASGDYDGAKKTMQYAALLLRKNGMPARFVSLGKVWHTLPNDLSTRLAKPLAWVVRGDDATEAKNE